MLERPTISIILPVYNGEKYIKNTIQSILSQSFSNYELVIVDDGSTDGSVPIIEEIHDSRIKLIKESNQGICAARNNGLNNTTAEYVMFCDHDDEYLPGYLQYVASEIEKNSVDIVKFGCIERYIQDDNIYNEHKIELPNKEYRSGECYKLLYLYSEENEYIWDGVYKKTLIEQIGGFDTFYKAGCEDIDILVKMSQKAETIKTVDQLVYVHNIRNAFSTSRRYTDNTYQGVLKTYQMRLDAVFSMDQEYAKYVYDKNKMLVWAVLGMFSFRTCTLRKKEILKKLNEVQRIIIKSSYRSKKTDKKSFMLWLMNMKFYTILSDICLIKRRCGI